MKKLIILILSILMLAACSAEKKTATIVEEFVGKDVSKVYEWCATLDDEYACEVTYEDVDDVEADIVVEQSIKAGSKLKENISFKVASGNEKEITMPYITDEVTKADIEVWADAVGLKSLTFNYEASDTVEKNHIIRFEPYTGVTKSTPMTFVISTGPAEPTNVSIEVKFGDYIGLTVAQFEAKAKELGLTPNHNTSRDSYNADINFGDIVWHGSGIYEKDEIFNYGVCINAITVKPNEYFAISEADFIAAAKKLNLTPKHIDGRDAYSSSVEKGYIVTHGNGVYVEGEEFKYGLSRGPAKVEQGYEGSKEADFLNYLSMLELKGNKKTSASNTVSSGRVISYNYGRYSSGDTVTYVVSTGPEDTSISVPNFEGKSEDELLKFLSSHGLYVGTRTEVDSTYSKGTIVSNDNGKKNKGDIINYQVASDSSGKAILESFDTIYQHVTHEGDYEHAEYDMHKYLFGRCFMNYDIVPTSYKDYPDGVLLAIYVDEVPLDYPVEVSLDAHIVCLISRYAE
ncbi:MAG: PASTA domain-containing protein [Erysipelotrichaceae bacterium]|nr:PASTA domain-containing protein [Erysipelotrichaceae bacterium]